MDTSQLFAAIDEEIARLTQARSLLAGTNGTSRNGHASGSVAVRAKRQLSPEARERIAAAQRKRWAKQKKATK